MVLEEINIDEQKILRLLKQRDHRAMEMIYDRFAPILYGVGYRIARDEPLAEELLKECFQYAWKHHRDFDEAKQGLSLWLVNIMRMIAKKKLPFDKFLKNRSSSDYVNTNDEEELANGNFQTYQMTKEQRTVLELFFLGGGKLNEVSKQVGINEQKVKQILREAVKHYNTEVQEAPWK